MTPTNVHRHSLPACVGASPAPRLVKVDDRLPSPARWLAPTASALLDEVLLVAGALYAAPALTPKVRASELEKLHALTGQAFGAIAEIHRGVPSLPVPTVDGALRPAWKRPADSDVAAEQSRWQRVVSEAPYATAVRFQRALDSMQELRAGVQVDKILATGPVIRASLPVRMLDVDAQWQSAFKGAVRAANQSECVASVAEHGLVVEREKYLGSNQARSNPLNCYVLTAIEAGRGSAPLPHGFLLYETQFARPPQIYRWCGMVDLMLVPNSDRGQGVASLLMHSLRLCLTAWNHECFYGFVHHGNVGAQRAIVSSGGKRIAHLPASANPVPGSTGSWDFYAHSLPIRPDTKRGGA